MKPKTRLQILDDQDFELFAEKHGPQLNMNLQNWIQLITVSNGSTELKFQRINGLAFFIFLELGGRTFGEPHRFDVSEKCKSFQQFVYAVNHFSAMQIPFFEWNELAEKLIDSLAKLTEENRLDFDSQHCRDVTELAASVFARLKQRRGFHETFTDFLNGAL